MNIEHRTTNIECLIEKDSGVITLEHEAKQRQAIKAKEKLNPHPKYVAWIYPSQGLPDTPDIST